MADTGIKEDSTWPMPKFSFDVDFGPELTGISFREVSGMDKEVQSIEYRASNNPLFSTLKMPGIVKYGNVTMKHGIFVGDNTFWNWMSGMSMNTIPRRTIIIRLRNEAGKVTMQWSLANAWPTKITGTVLKLDGNEVAVDTIEVAYESLTILNTNNA